MTLNTSQTQSVTIDFGEAIQNSPTVTANVGSVNSTSVAGSVLTINFTAPATAGNYNTAISVSAKDLAGNVVSGNVREVVQAVADVVLPTVDSLSITGNA